MAVDAKVIERNLDLDSQIGVQGKLIEGFGNPGGQDGPAIIGRSREQFGYGYYRKSVRGTKVDGSPEGDDGWVRLEQDCPVNRVMYIDQPDNEGFGWTYMGRYGRVYPGRPFDLRTQQFQFLLEMGGEHEFPVSQIIEMGWHRKAPKYVGATEYSRGLRGKSVVFSQLEGFSAEDLADMECTICHAKMRPAKFGGAGDLERHEIIFHRQQSSNHDMARTLASEMGKVVGAIQSDGDAALSPQLSDVLTRLVEQNQALISLLANKDASATTSGMTLVNHDQGANKRTDTTTQSKKGASVAAQPSTDAPAEPGAHGSSLEGLLSNLPGGSAERED